MKKNAIKQILHFNLAYENIYKKYYQTENIHFVYDKFFKKLKEKFFNITFKELQIIYKDWYFITEEKLDLPIWFINNYWE